MSDEVLQEQNLRPYQTANINAGQRIQMFNEPMARVNQYPLVECINLTKRYVANRAALNKLSMWIEPGHIVGLLGPNGSGKTTLIKLINGLLQPTSGKVLIYGVEPGPDSKAIISYLPERTYIEAQKTVIKLVDFFDDMYSDFDRSRCFKLLEDLGINPNDRLKSLSKGTKEKVQLILVMSRDAHLYILDEPIAGVDPAGRDYIINTVLKNYNPKSSILICTHLISDIEQILDDVIFIRKGELVGQCPASKIRNEMNTTIDAYFREVFAC